MIARWVRHDRHIWFAFLLTGAGLVSGGCTDEKIVYRDRAPFNPPPDSTAGFLGYFDVASGQTTCGNCHVGHQNDWGATKHARAWADLQASGSAQESCNTCHTLNEHGNATTGPAGYLKVADSAYHDVQCESCHGPGLTHVLDPDIDANKPLASVRADTALQSGCGGCHAGEHQPFVEQWKQSAHGSGPGFNAASTNATCQPCHEGKTALAVKFGVSSNYLEKDSATAYQRIVCAVCHDPHGSPYEAQLRRAMTPTTDNLCVTCHSRTGVPPWSAATSATSNARGPHGAQGLLVIGQNVGWIPPDFAYDTNRIVSSHGTEANTRLCATCHVVRKTITDAATGAFQFQSVGHLFVPIPCTEADGTPTVNQDCAFAQRDFGACATSNCHLTQQAARSAFQVVEGRLNNLLDQLWTDTDNDAVIEATDVGLFPKILARGTPADLAALDMTNNTVTVAKGALWNGALASTNSRPAWRAGRVNNRGFTAHPSSGNGVHNPFLLEALLVASIDAVKNTYGVSTPPELDLRVQATPPPGLKVRRQ